ncbi:MAG: acetylglutamate kinase [Tunicatimonas sp.]
MTPTRIIKIGGRVIEQPELLTEFLRDFARLDGPKVLVHGGGRNATQLAQRLGQEATLIDGRRVTDDAMLEVVVMVYGGLVNKQIVSNLQSFGCDALGMTGADLDCILATKRPPNPVDYGWVGDVQRVNATVFQQLLEQNAVPVLAPLTHDGRGQLLNTNADTIASRVAEALSPSKPTELYYFFEKDGVLANPTDDSSVIAELSEVDYRRGKEAGTIAAGMLPKLDNGFAALRGGVKKVYIGHHHALPAVGTDSFNGTQLCLSPP